MLRRLVFIAFLLNLLCLALLSWLVREHDPGPRAYDVAGAVKLLPPPRPIPPEQRALLQAELARAQAQVDQVQTQLVPAPTVESDPHQAQEKLSDLAAKLALADQNPDQLRSDLLELRQLWIEGREDTLTLANSPPSAQSYPTMPPFALQAYAGLQGTPEAAHYLQSYEDLQKSIVEGYRSARQSWEAGLAAQLALQSRIRELRDAYLTRAYELGFSPSDLQDERFGQALEAELNTIRIRFYYKGLQFRLHWHRELEAHNYLSMLREVGVPIFALALTVVLVPMSGKVPLRGRRGRLVSLLFLYVVLWMLSASMVRSDLLIEISVLIFVAANLVLFRAWRVAGVMLADWLARTLRFRDPVSSRRRVVDSISWLAGLSLAFLALETAIRLLTVGRGLLFWVTVGLSNLVFLAYYLVLAYSWRTEIVFGLRTLRIKADWLGQGLTAFLVMPFLFPVWLGMDLLFCLVTLLQMTEGGRKLATGALRAWLERMGGKRLVPRGAPEEYSREFLAYEPTAEEILPLCDPAFLPRLQKRLDDWLDGGSPENRLLIVGRPGSGKRPLVDLVERQYHARVPILRIRLTERLLEEQQLLEHLQLTGTLSEAAGQLAQRPRTIIAIEGVHYLFLSALGGFNLLRSLIVLWRLTPPNIFWLGTAGYHAQAYLNRAVDSEAESTLELPAWSEEALQKAILDANARTGQELEFDPQIWTQPPAERDETPADGLETQYFRMLWEHSGGNPATARALWLRSLEPQATGMLATLPASNNLARLQSAPTQTHLVLAAVVRHESLTEAETTLVTDLPPRMVRLALAQAAEWGVLRHEPGGAYRMEPLWVKDLEILLKRKNMLYAL